MALFLIGLIAHSEFVKILKQLLNDLTIRNCFSFSNLRTYENYTTRFWFFKVFIIY